MRAHRDCDEEWVVGEFLPDGRHIYMAWGGEGHGCYLDHATPERAEKFDTAQEARDWLRKDPEARHWHENHPKAKVLRMRSGFTVYPPK